MASFFFWLHFVMAQGNSNPASQMRPRGAEESSSFMGDPDPLDPLPVNRENLKEDDEPVLEDIRQVLNAPALKKKSATKKMAPKIMSPAAPATAPIPKSKNKRAAKRKLKTPSVTETELATDDPDLNLENQFHTIYKRFNAEPTSAQMWIAKSTDRAADTYTVQKGDTLWSVSQTLFGDPTFWPKIWSLNRETIENPHFIYPGDKVLFYPGTQSDSPALAVAKEGDGVYRKEKYGADAAQADDDEKASDKVSRSVGKIPDSLPIYRNDSYFLPPRLLKVELKNLAVPVDVITSDILLTDKEVESETELTKEELGKGRCGGDHVIGTKLKSTEGELVILEPLETIKTDVGEIFSYRQVGSAVVLSVDRIRITNCTSVLSRDLVFISPSVKNGLRTTKSSQQEGATLIGGPGIGTQKFFSTKQLAYINLGAQNVEIGQTLTIKSQLTEKVSGQVKILDKFGNFGIGLIVDVDDLVEIGDQLLLQ